MAIVGLLSCTKSKRSYRCKAKDLYSPSPWFPRAYEYVKKAGADKVFILSALYGLVPEDKELDPYEKTLYNASSRERRSWADRVIADLSKISDLQNDTYIIIAGQKYYEYLLPYLRNVILPLKGLSIGYWIPELDRLIKEYPGLDNHKEPEQIMDGIISCSFELHRLFNSLKRFRHPYDQTQIPSNGIYIMFEEGEKYKGLDRIVRVGTHTSPDRLRARIRDHFYTENKDGSIFRKNIGRAMLNRDNDPYLRVWEYDLSKTSNPEILKQADKDYQKQMERKISQYIRQNISFAFIPIENKAERLRLEEAIIATLNSDTTFRSSPNWYGNYSPKREIRSSGLWLVRGLEGRPLSNEELIKIKVLAGIKSNATSPIPKTIRPKPAERKAESDFSAVNARAFAQELESILKDARSQRKRYVDIVSGDLHRRVGGYPGRNHKMPTCCQVMYSFMKENDEVLASPPSGKGATLRIRYWI